LHYLELEEEAHRHIGEIEPLKTDMIVDHGAAPAAGFETERTPGDFREETNPHQDASSVPPAAQQSQQGELLLEFDKPAASSLVVREACAIMRNRVQAVIPFNCFAVYLVSGEFLLPQYLNGPSARGFSSRPIPIGEGLSGWVVRNERPIVNGNPTVEPNYLSESDLFSATSSALSIPLKGVSGAVIGALTVYTAKQTAYSGADLQTLQSLQSEFSPLLEVILRFESQDASSRPGEVPEALEMRRFLEQIDEVHPEIGSSAAS
jgi:putative methionine-R-sulfoxide reductase with GAF domain